MSERDETREAVARAIGTRFKDAVAGSSGRTFESTGVHFPVETFADYADAALAALRIGSRFTVEGVECVVAVLRCEVTGNPVGTDTRQVGFPCHCENCSPPDKKERAAALQALADLDRDLI